MGVFSKSKTKKIIPSSPQELFRHLKKDVDIKFLWSHQDELLDSYCKNYISSKNVCFELPTGSGKSLVGLLIAEFRRIKENKRVVYLCPTKQLCAQIKKHSESYGIPTALLTGKQKDYDENLFIRYQRAQLIAITTYTGIFNINPRINDAEIIICDDAHAGDAYVSSFWTLEINRMENEDIFNNILRILKPSLDGELIRKMNYNVQSSSDPYLIDLVPKIKCKNLLGSLSNYFNECFKEHTSNYYVWQNLNGYLEFCNIFININNICIRPFISPTKLHQPFSNAKQRIFMSASVGLGGDLERAFGIEKIKKVPLPKHWAKRNTGRRLIIFPELATSSEERNKVLDNFKNSKDRKLILTNSNEVKSIAEEYFKESNIIFTSHDIENSLEPFTSSEEATLILANRYDGIDLPDDKCRKMLILGFPGASSFQERFFVQRLGSTIPLRSLINTRITQGLGRCTRNENDYALILMYDKELLKWLSSKNYTKLLNPELQAEIEFGLDFSQEIYVKKFVDAQEALFKRNDDWDDAELEIQDRLNNLSIEKDNSINSLFESSEDEIKYMYALIVRNYEESYLAAARAIDKLSGGNELSIYRMFWCYLKAESAFLQYEVTEDKKWQKNAIEALNLARKLNYYLPWLNDLYKIITKSNTDYKEKTVTNPIIISHLLDELQLRGNKFSNTLEDNFNKISSSKSKQFENALEFLGRMCGFESQNWDKEGSPDGLWLTNNNFGIVFEAKTDEDKANPISLSNVRQTLTHKEWLIKNNEIEKDIKIFTIMITNQRAIKKEAHSVCGEIFYIPQNEIINLYKNVKQILSDIRYKSNGLTEEERREIVLAEFINSNYSFEDIITMLSSKKLSDLKIA